MLSLFIMRHGDAEPGQLGQDDAERCLSQHGQAEVEQVAEQFEQAKLTEFDVLIHSPFRRARETAQVLLTRLSCQHVIESGECTPAGKASEFGDGLLALLEVQYPQAKRVLIVSHMPFVSYLVEHFSLDQQCPLFATAAVLRIDIEPGQTRGLIGASWRPR